METYNNNLELMMILRKEKAEEERQIEVERIKAQERADKKVRDAQAKLAKSKADKEATEAKTAASGK